MENNKLVILNTELTKELIYEGLAREFVSKVQNLRKSSGFDIADRIKLTYDGDDEIKEALEMFKDYVTKETLATEFSINKDGEEIDLNGHKAYVAIFKK